MKNLMAFALALTALATGAFAEETVEWNLGKVAVVAPKKPKAEMRAAVEELRYHLGLVAGSEFSDEAPFRFVFRRPKDAASLKPFESRYRIDGRTVWFWGDDGGSDAALDWGDNRGKTSRKRHGTRFAVSLFLENELGVRWLWPGEDGIEYAARRTVVLPAHKEASFETKLLKSEIRNYPHYSAGPRYLEASGYTPKPLRDPERAYENGAHVTREAWLLRHRLQDRAHFKYGHAYTKWKDRFEKTHPEYLNWSRSKRNRGDTGTQGRDRTKLCVSNEAVVDQIVADWLAAGTNEYLNVCENDSAFYCECEGCCALDVLLPGEKEFTHMTDRYCNLWNRIAKKAVAVRPDVKLVSYAYSHYRKAPRRERIEYPDNMVFGFVPSLMDDASAEFVRWRERGMRHFFLRPNFHHYLGTIPRGLEKVLFDNFHQCLDFGMIGVDYDAPPHRNIMSLEYYVTARMIADPAGKFEDFCREFYAGYGPAADDMRAYFELVRRHGEAARDEFMRVKFKELRIIDDSELAILQCFGRTEEGLREEFAVVDAAAKKWAGKLPERYAKRLEEVRLRAEHAILTFRYLTANRKLPQEEFVRRGEELIAYRLAHRDAMPDNWTSVFGTWTGEIRTWKCNAPYRVLQCDGGTLDPRGFKYGWSLNFEGMSFGRWRSGDAYSCVTNDTASKDEWSCRLQADRKSETRDDNLPVIPGAKYRLTADLRASAGAEGALIRVYAYPAPEKGFKGKNLVSREFRDLPADAWTTRTVEFVAPTLFPDSRREKYGPAYYENVVPHVQALGGAPGSSLHVDNIRIELLDEGNVVGLSTATTSAKIDLEGARITSFVSEGQEVLWMPRVSGSAGGTNWVHGGIPLCWPRFGRSESETILQHGFARLFRFRLVESSCTAARARALLELRSDARTRALWPHDFVLQVEVTLTDSLRLSMRTVNAGADAFTLTCGFHPYFRLGDRDRAHVTGTDGLPFCDSRVTREFGKPWKGDMKLLSSFDHVFVEKGLTAAHSIVDPVLGRTIVGTSSGVSRLVVWNPGAEEPVPDKPGPGQLSAGDWRHLVCVEPAVLWKDAAVVLPPGGRHEISFEISTKTL